MIKRNIYITTQKEGIHCYPQALTDPALADVSFLGYPHRHMFHIKVKMSVTHNDRELEFILVKREIEQWFSTMYDIDYKSCEMVAEDLLAHLHELYGMDREIVIDVAEDGENGAEVEWVPKTV